MRPIKLFLFFVTILYTTAGFAQDSSRIIQPRLLLDFPVLEFPHMNYAAGMSFNKRNQLASGGTVQPSFGDFIRGYESPSMQQALAVTKNLHATNYYFNNRLWNKWIAPVTPKKKFLNRVAANATAGAIDYVLAYHLMVFGPVWLHEEFHRNGITHQCASSFDETYYRFGGGIPSGSVSHVLDEDMMRYKDVAPQNMVRSFAAGIEAQYSLVRALQKDNFFHRTNQPNVIMNILVTNQAIGYVNQFKKGDYDASIDSMNKYGVAVKDRDFVGWDFTAWVYDLHRINEPYSNRGTHPNGTGVNRAIKRSQLTPEEDQYLSKMGRMQYLNFISPSMVGIHRIKLNEQTAFNFSVRHILNSFGYDLGVDLFLQTKKSHWLVGFHGYRNKEKLWPGIEVENPSINIRAGKTQVPLQARAMLWLQPKDQLFTSTKAEPGALVQLRAFYPTGKTLKLYAEAEAKTGGWVAANPYLDPNVTVRMGVTVDINK
jgi:hypothetical protein